MDNYRRVVEIEPAAEIKIQNIISKEPDTRVLFRAAIQSLKEDYPVPANGNRSLTLLDGSHTIEFDVFTDRIEKTRYITVIDIR